MGEGLNIDNVVSWATWAISQLGGRPERSEDSPKGGGASFLTGLGVDPIPEGYLLPQPNRPDPSRPLAALPTACRLELPCTHTVVVR
jgi:hypothetical protein